MMTAEKTQIRKLQILLNSATNERQRKMYQALLDKALAELAPEPAPSQQKTTKTSTNKQTRDKNTKKKAESVPPVSKQTSSKKKNKFKKEKASNNDSVVVTEEISATSKSTSILLETQQDKESTTDQTKAKKQSKKSKSSNKNTSSDSKSNNQPYFSGVGIIRGTPYLEDEKVFVTLDEQQYELKQVSRERFDLFKSEIEEKGSREMLLKVYPNILHFKDGSPSYQLFRLVQFYLNKEQYSELPEEFIFRGIWRVVSYCPSPVITIYRNIDRLRFYKTLSSNAQKYFAKSQDFPVVWNAPVEAFEYDSERKKSEQMPCYFVEVKAIFKNGQYIVTEMLSQPTLEVPRFIRQPKPNRNSQNKSKQLKELNQDDKKSLSSSEIVELN